MADPYVASLDFRHNLNRWLVRKSAADLDSIAKNSQRLPTKFRNYTKRLYLPISVTDEFVDAAAFNRAVLPNHVAWTKDEIKAREHFRNKSNSTNKYNILISKNVEMRHIILDLDEFATFMGIPQLQLLGFDIGGLMTARDQKQVIVSKDVLINRSDYTILS